MVETTIGKYFYDIIPYPQLNEDIISCDRYPDCDICSVRFKCWTQATKIIVLVDSDKLEECRVCASYNDNWRINQCVRGGCSKVDKIGKNAYT